MKNFLIISSFKLLFLFFMFFSTCLAASVTCKTGMNVCYPPIGADAICEKDVTCFVTNGGAVCQPGSKCYGINSEIICEINASCTNYGTNKCLSFNKEANNCTSLNLPSTDCRWLDEKLDCPPPPKCLPTQVVIEGKCVGCPSVSKIVKNECVPCPENSISKGNQCILCSQDGKPCNCPSDKTDCTSSCIPVSEICNHGVPTCPSDNVFCGGICMNTLDRICVKGKIKKCPIKSIVNITVKNTCKPCPPNQVSVRSQNKCTACPPNHIIVENECTTCPSGEMAVNVPVEGAYNYGYCCNTVTPDAQSCCKTSGIFYKDKCYGRKCYNMCAIITNSYRHCVRRCIRYYKNWACITSCFVGYLSNVAATELLMKPSCECMPLGKGSVSTWKALPIYGSISSISSIEAELKRKKNDAESKKK